MESEFLILLLCLSKRNDIPTLCKDIRRLLNKHVQRLLVFSVGYGKRVGLMYNITIVLPAESLQCHRVFVKHYGKTVVRVKSMLKVLDPLAIRDVEERIVDSLPGIQYKPRLSQHNVLCYTTVENNGDCIPYNNEYVEVPVPFCDFEAFLKQDLVMTVWGITRNKHDHLWSMSFALSR